jgi:molybdopterin converting factor subunit 1
VKLRVLLFASWADALQSSDVELELSEEATAGDVVRAIEGRAGAALLARPAVAVNRRIASASTRLTAGDEVAIIPPVAGG